MIFISALKVVTVTVSVKCPGKDASVWARKNGGEKKVYITLLSPYYFASKMSNMRTAHVLHVRQ